MKLSNCVFHPLFFTLFPILFFISHNKFDLFFSTHGLALSLLVLSALLLIGILLFFINLLIRDLSKSSLVTSWLSLIFFSSGHLYYDWFKHLKHAGLPFRFDETFFIAIMAIVALLVTSLLLRLKNTMSLNSFLNLVGLILVLTNLWDLGKWLDLNQAFHTPIKAQLQVEKVATKTLPDIYYIILDGHARTDQLKEVYHYDNQNFDNFLESKGFYLAKKSTSNYGTTFHSLASSLNAEYIHHLPKPAVDKQDRSHYYNRIHHNQVAHILKQQGYQIINLSSGYGPTKNLASADVNISKRQMGEVPSLFLRTTLLGVILSDALVKSTASDQMSFILKKLDQLPDHSHQKPRFILAHLVIPHPPYLFDRNGRPLKKSEMKFEGHVWLQQEKYVDQLIYIDNRIKDFINHVFEQSPEKRPVILLQSDHGSAYLLSKSGLKAWANPTEAMMHERLSILNAYYFPPPYRAKFYPEITPVNSFRVLFNTLFDAKVPLLKDEIYFSAYRPDINAFQEVTPILLPEKNRSDL